MNVQVRIFKKRRKITRKWQTGHEIWKRWNKAGAGEASGLMEVSMIIWSPQYYKYSIRDPEIKFEESSLLVPQLSRINKFGPYEENWSLGNSGPPNIQEIPHDTLGRYFGEDGSLSPCKFRMYKFSPLVLQILQPDPYLFLVQSNKMKTAQAHYITQAHLTPLLLPNPIQHPIQPGPSFKQK